MLRGTISAVFDPVELGPLRASVRVLVEGKPSLEASLVGRLNGACGSGSERWPVKTLQDAAASRVATDPRETTVAALTRLPPPPFLSAGPRHEPVEYTTYQVRAQLVSMSIQDDSDLKLIIADPRTGATMAAELPAASCTLQAAPRLKVPMRSARAAVERICGTPSANGRYTALHAETTITGVGFFDSVHGQRGVAPNGIELHPVLGFSARDCGFSNATVRG